MKQLYFMVFYVFLMTFQEQSFIEAEENSDSHLWEIHNKSLRFSREIGVGPEDNKRDGLVVGDGGGGVTKEAALVECLPSKRELHVGTVDDSSFAGNATRNGLLLKELSVHRMNRRRVVDKLKYDPRSNAENRSNMVEWLRSGGNSIDQPIIGRSRRFLHQNPIDDRMKVSCKEKYHSNGLGYKMRNMEDAARSKRKTCGLYVFTRSYKQLFLPFKHDGKKHNRSHVTDENDSKADDKEESPSNKTKVQARLSSQYDVDEEVNDTKGDRQKDHRLNDSQNDIDDSGVEELVSKGDGKGKKKTSVKESRNESSKIVKECVSREKERVSNGSNEKVKERNDNATEEEVEAFEAANKNDSRSNGSERLNSKKFLITVNYKDNGDGRRGSKQGKPIQMELLIDGSPGAGIIGAPTHCNETVKLIPMYNLDELMKQLRKCQNNSNPTCRISNPSGCPLPPPTPCPCPSPCKLASEKPSETKDSTIHYGLDDKNKLSTDNGDLQNTGGQNVNANSTFYGEKAGKTKLKTYGKDNLETGSSLKQKEKILYQFHINCGDDEVFDPKSRNCIKIN